MKSSNLRLSHSCLFDENRIFLLSGVDEGFMKVTIDKAGRVVIPKSIRDDLGLQAGDVLELDRQGDSLQLRPKARTRRKGCLLVFRSGLRNYDIAAAIEKTREERTQDLKR